MILEYNARLSNGRYKKCFVNLDQVSLVLFNFTGDSSGKLDSILFEIPGSVREHVSSEQIVNTDFKPEGVTDEEHAQGGMKRIYKAYQQYALSKSVVLPQA